MGMGTETETGMDRPGRSRRNGTRNGVEAGASGAGSRVQRPERSTLVGDVLEYWSFYKGEGADSVSAPITFISEETGVRVGVEGGVPGQY